MIFDVSGNLIIGGAVSGQSVNPSFLGSFNPNGSVNWAFTVNASSSQISSLISSSDNGILAFGLGSKILVLKVDPTGAGCGPFQTIEMNSTTNAVVATMVNWGAAGDSGGSGTSIGNVTASSLTLTMNISCSQSTFHNLNGLLWKFYHTVVLLHH
jgi:hypothetical protein